MERIDSLQRRGLVILQDPASFCFGIDAVLLSDFAKAKPGEKVMDLCAGNGVVSLLMYGRYPLAAYEALELQEESASLAKRSIGLNHLEEQIHVQQGDVRAIRTLYKASSYDVVTANPPYLKGQGRENEREALRLARHEVSVSLQEVLAAAAYLLRFGGRFYLVHRAERLPEILTRMKEDRLEPKKIRLVHPFIGKEASQVLIQAVKGGKEGAKVLPPLITYDAPGVYTREVLSIYQEDQDSHGDIAPM